MTGMGFKEFVALMAALMAVNALSIDAMLPVLPQIGESLGIATDNEQQWVITSYLLGFGVAQLFYGPLADHYGRKPVLLAGLGIFVLFTIISAFAATLDVMIAARALQGMGAAGTRVLVVTIIRDLYSGRTMARVMSLTFIVFLAAPVVAPALGQAIAQVAPWQWIFGALAVFGAGTAAWTWRRLPESLQPEDRRAMSPDGVLQAFRLVLSSRIAVGYMLALTAMLGALFAFINSVQQVFADALDAPELLTSVFALSAGLVAVASFINARIVERVGTRRVSHLALLGFIVITGAHGLFAAAGYETVWSFAALQSAAMFCFGLIGANFNSIAMEPLGNVAGTASSALGFVTTVGGALIGFYVGQQFNGTVIPLTAGFFTCGVAALAIVATTERGRLWGRTKATA
ncbi:MAG TPA: multidrug effflux MFS transporter [Woeseiaceae bacterium]|nr:multidrug effflux MFS transporter [Woeseiaceae bacterium]